MSWIAIAVVTVVMALSALLQGAVGFGLGMLAIPVLIYLAPTDFSSYQFNLIREGKRYKVAEIVEGGMAGEAGLRTGDVLISVNGNSVSDLSLFETQRLFLMDGQDRVLSVKRRDQTLEIKLRSFRID